MSEHLCSACDIQWTHASGKAPNALGWGVSVLGAGVAALMLLLIRQGNTGLGGVAAVAAMLCLGLGTWLLGRALPRCPECGSKSVQSPSS